MVTRESINGNTKGVFTITAQHVLMSRAIESVLRSYMGDIDQYTKVEYKSSEEFILYFNTYTVRVASDWSGNLKANEPVNIIGIGVINNFDLEN